MIGNEFELIDHYFKTQPIKRKDVLLGIGDDAAVICVPPHCQLVVTTDTLVAGTHFLPNAPPEFIGHKALASNLSDLAAMGAVPAWCSLALTLPEVDKTWLNGFCDGFYSLAKAHNVQLIGGDTTKGPLSITITLQGFVPEGQAIMRKGACVGDEIYVTGCLGDSAAGLALILKGGDPKNEQEKQLQERHYYSSPRVLASHILRKFASSAIDISDGLMADLDHILKASGVSARINADALPLSDLLLNFAGSHEKAAKIALCSGEEYELCFTVPACHRAALYCALARTNTPITCIGHIQSGKEGAQIIWQNNPVNWALPGWDHFSADCPT